jgi:hypothetical protein
MRGVEDEIESEGNQPVNFQAGFGFRNLVDDTWHDRIRLENKVTFL